MADTCIGRVPETAACADKFRREGVDITLSVTPKSDRKELENQLDQLLYLSLDLIGKGIPHRICFGAHMEAYIKDKNSLDEFLFAVLSVQPDGSRGPVDRNKPDELVYSIRPQGGEGVKKP